MFAQQSGPEAAAVAEGLQLYTANCAVCHGPEGDTVQGINVRSGQFRRAANDADVARIITTGIPGTAMPPNNFPRAQLSALIAYLRSPRIPVGAAVAGNVRLGQALFESRGCLNCHRVQGKGSRVGPDLSDIGSLRPAAALERSILEPNAVVLPQHRYVQATTRNGVAISGRRLNEDTLTVQLIDSKEQLVSHSRADLREYVVLKTSPMPSYQGKLTPQELTDLVGYLASLKFTNTP